MISLDKKKWVIGFKAQNLPLRFPVTGEQWRRVLCRVSNYAQRKIIVLV